MKNEDYKKFVENMQNKLGKENSAIISDDLATLISDNISMNEEISKRDSKIKEQDQLNQKLVSANSSLLQQVGTSSFEEEKPKRKESKEDTEEKISWEDCFDKKGNFLK